MVEEEESLQNNLEDLSRQKTENAEKLARKRAEFERMEQRLMQLKTVKAPYQDELDGLEQELSGLYVVYLNKFRSLEYLEAELAKIHRCWSSYGLCAPDPIQLRLASTLVPVGAKPAHWWDALQR